MSVEVIRAAPLSALPHGFLGRPGGVSTGVLAGLNVGTGSSDDRAAIDENRRRAATALLPGAELVTVHQIHSAKAEIVTHGWPLDSRPHADAMATRRRRLLLGILTADCAPVLLADVQAGVVGAAHAGWRGALGGVTDAVVTAMEQLGAKRSAIAAVVGPCIAQRSYEVDEAFRARFVAADAANARFFDCGEKPHFDLAAYVVDRLLGAGVGSADATGHDTYADADRFFSYRRATHAGDRDYGRQLSAIGLP